jgi:hypothetical protein
LYEFGHHCLPPKKSIKFYGACFFFIKLYFLDIPLKLSHKKDVRFTLQCFVYDVLAIFGPQEVANVIGAFALLRFADEALLTAGAWLCALAIIQQI